MRTATLGSDLRENGAGMIASRLHADGRLARELRVPSPGTRHEVQINNTMVDKKMHYPRMNGRAVFRAAVTHMSGVVEDILKSEGLRKEDISLYIFHQANLHIVEAVASRLGVDESRPYNNIERYGNTTAAALPIARSEALDSGRIQPGDLVMLPSFGSGFTWAGALMRW